MAFNSRITSATHHRRPEHQAVDRLFRGDLNRQRRTSRRPHRLTALQPISARIQALAERMLSSQAAWVFSPFSRSAESPLLR